MNLGDKKEIEEYINSYRRLHQAPDIVWDDTIADYSQKWANYLSINNKFEHSTTDLYGENLAYFSGYNSSDPVILMKKAIDLWYDEIKLYDFSKPGFKSETGHFTCLVWKPTKKFGMGYAIQNDKVIVTFNSSPPCNEQSSFLQNVLPKIQSIVGSVKGKIEEPVDNKIQPEKSYSFLYITGGIILLGGAIVYFKNR